ncbi:MAG: UDP-N-acetylglucosamine 2-epimerase (non-hydrolyzing) [Cyclobacteriaceae bacterium]
MKIATIIGARPQFIKSATISRVIQKDSEIEEIIVHTGQHYDSNMSDVFFSELEIPKPNYHLNVGSGSHGEMTGEMLKKIEKVLLDEKPDWVLVYGDTNSTIAGALAASKLHIPIAHVEAGLRSFNMKMPEEVNRILTDRISSVLFCPTETAINNLEKEGFGLSDFHRVINVGDVMYDATLYYSELSKSKDSIINKLGISVDNYILFTSHRAENTDHNERLEVIVSGLINLAKTYEVVFPLHPRTRKVLESSGLMPLLREANNVKLIDPVGFLEMVQLLSNCKFVVTDSGGVQKEAFFHNKQCITLRDETEWIETVESGWNRLLIPFTTEKLMTTVDEVISVTNQEKDLLYGSGDSADKIVSILKDSH